MDNLTHTLAGFALARAGGARATPGATAALVLASNLPDADIVFALQDSLAYFEHHRGLSHSVVGAPLLALALAVGLRLLVRGARLPALFLCCMVGVAGHVFMDLWTSYGTRVLAPFDATWHTWDLVFIVDPWIVMLLGLTLVLARGAAGSRVSSVGLGLLLAYVGARGVLHAQALDAAAARLPREPALRVAALPTPLDPLRWRILADAGAAYWTGELHLRRPSAPLLRRPKQPESAVVARVRESSEVAAIFLDFSSFPWLELRETAEGTAVTWRDLRFEQPGGDTFVTRVVVGPDGRIRSESFRF